MVNPSCANWRRLERVAGLVIAQLQPVPVRERVRLPVEALQPQVQGRVLEVVFSDADDVDEEGHDLLGAYPGNRGFGWLRIWARTTRQAQCALSAPRNSSQTGRPQ
jgi:hypothetical protein